MPRKLAKRPVVDDTAILVLANDRSLHAVVQDLARDP
jgi:hypothetical protein